MNPGSGKGARLGGSGLMKSPWPVAFLMFAQSLQAGETPSQPAPFSTARPGPAIPAGWNFNTLPKVARATRFDLVRDDHRTVLRAVSDAAAATLTEKLRVDTAVTPRLAWSWKVSNVIATANLAAKDRDDYAARVYVLFDYPFARLALADRLRISLARMLYGQELPAAALCYVWDNRHPIGSTAWSAYTDRVRMIVVESGTAHVGQWRQEQRDVAADFEAAFSEPPPPISGSALAADTDNTGESVTAWFGDLAFRAGPSGERSEPP